jgi:hypothetical protein
MFITVLLIFLGVCAAIVALFVVIVRRLGRSQKLLRITRTDAVRANAKADANAQVVDRVTNVAELALQHTGEALHVAAVIEEVNDKMDELLGFVTGEIPTGGKHAANLRVIPGSQDQRYIA